MRNSLLHILIIFFFCLVAGTGQVFSQEITDPEAEYSRIREVAFAGNYEEAVASARKLVKAFPDYGDARILLGRILGWQKNFEEAGAVLDSLLQTDPDNADALAARNDITLWSKESTPVSTDLRLGYFFDTFGEPYDRFWQVFRAGAGHRFGWGQLAGGVNVGNARIGKPVQDNATELQFEAEAWPTLGKKNYAYVSYAYSPGTYFPTHRAAAELWQVLPAGWAVSAGVNYYYFDRNSFIALASVEKYAGKFWLSLKGFMYFKDDGPTTSVYLNARRYFNDRDYLQLTLGTGTAPDEPFDIQTDLMRLNAHSVRLAWNFSATPRLMIRLGGGFSIEEYDEDEWRNRFEGGMSLSYALKLK